MGKRKRRDDLGSVKQLGVIANLGQVSALIYQENFITYLSELHDEVHEVSSTRDVVEVRGFVEQIGKRNIASKASVQYSLSRAELTEYIDFDLYLRV